MSGAGIIDRKGWFFIAIVLGAAVLVPAANLMVPEGSPLHVSDYLVPLLGKYLCYALLAVAVLEG